MTLPRFSCEWQSLDLNPDLLDSKLWSFTHFYITPRCYLCRAGSPGHAVLGITYGHGSHLENKLPGWHHSRHLWPDPLGCEGARWPLPLLPGGLSWVGLF